MRFLLRGLVLLAGLTAGQLVLAQAVVWTATVPGPAGTPVTKIGCGSCITDRYASTVDAAGHLVVTGQNQQDFAKWFTAKIDAVTHQVLWSRVGGAGTGRGVAVDAAGDVYVTGANSFGPTSSQAILTKLSGADGSQLWSVDVDQGNFRSIGVGVAVGPDQQPVLLIRRGPDPAISLLAKHDKVDGHRIWAGLGDGDPVGFAKDAAGDVYTAGNYTDFLTSAPSVAVIRFANSGSPLGGAFTKWIRRFTATNFARDLAIDPSGNVIVTMDEGTGTASDIRTAKLVSNSNDGTIVWNILRVFPGQADSAGAVTTNTAGDVFVVAQSANGAGGNDLAVIKYGAATGVVRWDRPVSSAQKSFTPRAATHDANGDLLVVAEATSAATQADLYTAKFADATGDLLWSNTFDATGGDERATAVVAAPGALYAIGESTEAGDTREIRVTKFSNLPPAKPMDFSGDQKADLLFRHTDGRNAIWLMNGLTPASTTEIFPAGTAWQVAHVVDMNGDGKRDLVWQHPDGRVTVYLMDGTTAITKQLILPAGGGWTVTHAGDMDGDRKSDLVFTNADGSTAVWTMDGVTMTAGTTLLGPGTGWSVAHLADFDGDGRRDILWKHTDGSHAIWLMDGIFVNATTQILNAGGWTAKHAVDLDGDGKADIVWQHTDGRVAAWLMFDTQMTAGAGLLGAGTGWSVARTGDFNGDGKADLLFQHTDGRAAIYLMDGLAVVQAAQILNAGGGWSAKRAQDMDGDGKADIVWENVDGRVAVWLMNGTAMTSGGSLLPAGTGFSVSGVSP